MYLGRIWNGENSLLCMTDREFDEQWDIPEEDEEEEEPEIDDEE
jgi:DNA-directed RNA polymerase